MPAPGPRAAARKLGEIYYLPDTPCKKGHITRRYTANGACVECQVADALLRYKEDAEYKGRMRRTWKKHDAARSQKRSEGWREMRDSMTEDEWRKYRDRVRVTENAYNARHGNIKRRRAAEWRSKKLKRHVPWGNQDDIAKIYADCPPGMEVDHKIPLCGKYISGLHVEENLQHLKIVENRKKSNRWTPRKFYPCEILFAETSIKIAGANV